MGARVLLAALGPDPRRLVALGVVYPLLLVRVLQRRRQEVPPAAPG